MNFMQIALLAAGGYFLYEYYMGGGTATTEGTNGQTSGGSSSSSTTSIAAQVKAKGLADSAAVGGKLNFWQWNYHLHEVSPNTPLVDPKTTNMPVSSAPGESVDQAISETLLTYEQWASYQPTSAGLSGIVVGQWWSARYRGTGIGTQRASAYERANKRFIR